MKEVKFTCNLCGETILERNKLVSYVFDSTIKKDDGHFGAYRISSSLAASDVHICADCIDTILKS